MNKPIIIFLFQLLSFTLLAQDFNAAILVLNSGDSLLGFVQRFSESKISKEINFSLDEKGTEKTKYLPKDIKILYFIEEKLFFEPVLYTFRIDTVKKKEWRLAKLMLKGACSLYKLQLSYKEQNIVFEEENTNVYVLRKGGEDYVLKMNENIVNVAQNNVYADGYAYRYKQSKYYQMMLRYLMADAPKLKGKIDSLRFNDNSITNIVALYNADIQGVMPSVRYVHKVKIVKKSVVNTTFGVFRTYDYAAQKYLFLSTIEFAFLRQRYSPELNEKVTFQYGLAFRRIQDENLLRIAVFSHIYTKNALKKGFFISVGGSADYFLKGSAILPIVSPSFGLGYEIEQIQCKIMYENILVQGNALKIGVNYSL